MLLAEDSSQFFEVWCEVSSIAVQRSLTDTLTGSTARKDRVIPAEAFSFGPSSILKVSLDAYLPGCVFSGPTEFFPLGTLGYISEQGCHSRVIAPICLLRSHAIIGYVVSLLGSFVSDFLNLWKASNASNASTASK